MPDHFTAQPEPEQHPGGQPPPAHAHPRAERRVPDPAFGDDAGHAGADVVAVADERGERGDHEQRGEDVEHAHAALDVRQPVADQQHARDRAQQRGAGEPAADPDDEHDAQHARQRRREPPADGVVAEQRLADRDELLAQRRVDHELEAGVVLDAAVAQHLPRLRHVVLLVEDGGAAVGGAAEAREPDGRRDQPEDERDHASRAGGRSAAARRARRRAPAAGRSGGSPIGSTPVAASSSVAGRLGRPWPPRLARRSRWPRRPIVGSRVVSVPVSRSPGARRHAVGPGRGRVVAAGRRRWGRPTCRRGGHPAAARARRGAGRVGAGPGGLALRRRGGRAAARAARRGARGAHGAGRERRGDADGVRPRLPDRRRRGGRGAAGDVPARARPR